MLTEFGRNLSYNNISELTTDMFNVASLKKLCVLLASHLASVLRSLVLTHTLTSVRRYLQGNPLKHNVLPAIFEGIKKLEDFKADSPDTSAPCVGGEWMTAHNVSFCVLTDSTSAGTPRSWTESVP